MKIERVSENEIKCTLTAEDLAERQIRLGELAYGSEKTKTLFDDVMRTAHNEFGFDANNIPLVIEAVPHVDSISISITKVEDPEELDTRFAKFTPMRQSQDNGNYAMYEATNVHGADEILKAYEQIEKAQAAELLRISASDAMEDKAKMARSFLTPMPSMRLAYRFKTFQDVMGAARALDGIYEGFNVLFRDIRNGEFRLIIDQSPHTPAELNKIHNLLLEFSQPIEYVPSKEVFYKEREKMILRADALQDLAKLC